MRRGRYRIKQAVGCCLVLLCGAWSLSAQTNAPGRPAQPTHFLTRIGECESRIGGVEVVVSGVVEQGKATIQIQCRLNHLETACEVAPTNAPGVVQLIERISMDLKSGKQSAGRYENVEVSAFELQGKDLVEVMVHQGDSASGEEGCRLWLDQYNALSLSRLIASGKAVADWLGPRLAALE
ncbi:MAG TPA: hypothetical protein VMP11_20455 [Verrucomicrobiae bacterium]|nr:hypothetical protein [Verrucomicrobiae bacterium]